ncbi:MAG: class I SAM-dependent methyltransferase [Bacteroidota bacterium]
MATLGSRVYDDPDFFDQYISKRARPATPNSLLEKPVIDELIGSVSGLNILDIGCGDGRYGAELMQKGAVHYTGIDSSTRMIQRAASLHQEPAMTFEVEMVEGYVYPTASFDLVLSRLVLHYVADLQSVFQQIYQSLRPGGRFVASVEHPVITSCYEAYHQPGKRQDWIVDRYFEPGPRKNQWLGQEVIKYHLPLEQYLQQLNDVGFRLLHVRESAPRPELFADQQEYARRRRIPLFLMWEVQKPN